MEDCKGSPKDIQVHWLMPFYFYAWVVNIFVVPVYSELYLGHENLYLLTLNLSSANDVLCFDKLPIFKVLENTIIT